MVFGSADAKRSNLWRLQMARKTLTDDKGKKYEVDLPDDDDDDNDDAGDGDDADTIYLDEEDIAWLRRKRLEESDASRMKQTGSRSSTTAPKGKQVRIRAKSTSQSSTNDRAGDGRKRVLRLA